MYLMPMSLMGGRFVVLADKYWFLNFHAGGILKYYALT